MCHIRSLTEPLAKTITYSLLAFISILAIQTIGFPGINPSKKINEMGKKQYGMGRL